MPTKKPKPSAKSKPLEVAPKPPVGMKGKYAIAYWKRIAEELVRVGAITDLHLEALESLCRVWQDFRELSDWCESNPGEMVIEYDSGHVVEHPRVRLRQIAFTNLTKLWPKFGMTPEGLVKIAKTHPSAGQPPPANPLADFAARKYE